MTKILFLYEYEAIQKTSQYNGVYFHIKSGLWYARPCLKEQNLKHMYGGYFKDELDAAKRVNQLCEEFGIPPRNPEISGLPNQQLKVTLK